MTHLFTPTRREMLALGGSCLAAAAMGARPAYAQSQSIIQQALGEGQKFSLGGLFDVARYLAKRPYAAPANDLPDTLSGLPYDQYVAIRAKPEGVVWNGQNRGFALEPLHRGFIFTTPVSLFTIEDETVRRIGYDPNQFDFGKAQAPANLENGFSGFRILTTLDGPNPIETAIFQGATFFRALGKGQTYGAVARAITLRPAETRGEEFALFKAFWIERPGFGSSSLTFYALFDSESVVGVSRFTLRPGATTLIDGETTLFPRVNLDHVGWGGMTASYFFGPNDRRNVDDVRPAVHDASGLQMVNGVGEWLWRPLQNPETLQISAFQDANPRGLGLIQRDRDFTAFQDDDQRFERRASLWVEPLGEWGQGSVQLIEIPSNAEVNQNILSYWRPKQTIQAGSEVSFACRHYWGWTPPERPNLATVAATRSGRGSGGRRRRFLVDFTGETIATAPDIKPALTAGPGALSNIRLWPNPERKSLRVGFELDPGNEQASELRLVIENATGAPLSETWLYRWTP